MWCGDKDEIVNHIINKCSRLAQKEYKTKHHWLGKVIQNEAENAIKNWKVKLFAGSQNLAKVKI